MRFTTLFVDLDDTLYPKETGLWGAIRQRMTDYMRDQLGFPPEIIPTLRQNYFDTYGTTLRGLQIHYQVDAESYLAYVHDLPLEKYLKPIPVLRTVLSSLPQSKWIFTNADANHARRVLTHLEVEDCFRGIIDVRALGFLCKPHLEAYQRAMQLTGVTRAEECVLFDDAPRNLLPARELGMTTVLVGSTEPHPAANYIMGGWDQLTALLPELWDQTQASPGKDGKVQTYG